MWNKFLDFIGIVTISSVIVVGVAYLIYGNLIKTIVYGSVIKLLSSFALFFFWVPGAIDVEIAYIHGEIDQFKSAIRIAVDAFNARIGPNGTGWQYSLNNLLSPVAHSTEIDRFTLNNKWKLSHYLHIYVIEHKFDNPRFLNYSRDIDTHDTLQKLQWVYQQRFNQTPLIISRFICIPPALPPSPYAEAALISDWDRNELYIINNAIPYLVASIEIPKWR